MNSKISRWTKLVSIGAFSVILLQTQQALAVGFPTTICRPGFIQAGPRLCISQFAQGAVQFDTAMRLCRNLRARVATYGDLYYLYINTALDAAYNPNGKWLGEDLIRDDNALCGNADINVNGDGDQENFEGTCFKNDIRSYWCAHDDE